MKKKLFIMLLICTLALTAGCSKKTKKVETGAETSNSVNENTEDTSKNTENAVNGNDNSKENDLSDDSKTGEPDNDENTAKIDVIKEEGNGSSESLPRNYAGTRWKLACVEFYPINEYSEAEYKDDVPNDIYDLEVIFGVDGTAVFRNNGDAIIGVPSVTGNWEEDGFGGVRIVDTKDLQGQEFESYIDRMIKPHFTPADKKYAPNGNVNMLAYEGSGMCFYFVNQ